MHPSWYTYSTSITHAGSLQYLIIGYTAFTLYCIWILHADLVFLCPPPPPWMLTSSDAWDPWAVWVWYSCHHWGGDRRGEDSFGWNVVSVVEPIPTGWLEASQRTFPSAAERKLLLWAKWVQGVHFMYMHYNNLHCITVYGRIPSP